MRAAMVTDIITNCLCQCYQLWTNIWPKGSSTRNLFAKKSELLSDAGYKPTALKSLWLQDERTGSRENKILIIHLPKTPYATVYAQGFRYTWIQTDFEIKTL